MSTALIIVIAIAFIAAIVILFALTIKLGDDDL